MQAQEIVLTAFRELPAHPHHREQLKLLPEKRDPQYTVTSPAIPAPMKSSNFCLFGLPIQSQSEDMECSNTKRPDGNRTVHEYIYVLCQNKTETRQASLPNPVFIGPT
jgi:hypothetical protein